MPSLSAALLPFAVVGGGIAGGLLLYRQFYSESRAAESAFRLILNTVWILSGVAFVLGGFYVVGAFFITVGTWWAASNATRVHKSDLEADSIRARLANFRPSSGRRRQ